MSDTLDEVEEASRDQMRATVITAIAEADWPALPKHFIPAANAGHIYGMADVVVHLIASATTGNPDYVAAQVADYIRTRVAYQTSCGGVS